MLKCWLVRHKDDNLGEFVFAETQGGAIYLSTVYWNMPVWEIVAKRVPKLDGKELTRENVEAAGFEWLDDL